MTPDPPLRLTPLGAMLLDIKHACEHGAPLSALALALTLPDVCGRIEYPGVPDQWDRYGRWFDAWCANEIKFLRGTDCYALRCAFLHSGQSEFSGNAAPHANMAEMVFTRSQPPHVSSNGSVLTIKCAWGEVSGRRHERFAVSYQVEHFCSDMADAANAWHEARKGDPRVAGEIDKIMGLLPAPARNADFDLGFMEFLEGLSKRNGS